ncbi:histidine kinase [Streptomyces sp. HU2014]|uniref:ATP-binding protein n=1 Tax=Streptomyces sp. HU2014 TaxID=2939414 RepID=UPI00200BA4CF|nr:ATP-binding protein [Streptomyces sp. HU2014]UQI45062.1 histidine kinase [Streptomyces sp. HU2014]
MDTFIRPTSQSGAGLLEAMVGEGFMAALRDGLSRSLPVTQHPAHPARHMGGAARVPAQRRPAAVPAKAGNTKDPECVDTEAVLRRFTVALPTALAGSPATRPGLRTALLDWARLTLAGSRPPATWRSGGTGREGAGEEGPTAEEAWAVLLECALREAREGAHGDSALAARRASWVIRVLGAADGTGAAHPYPAAEAEQLWRERRRLARELHDQLAAPLSRALRHLEPRTAGEPAVAGDAPDGAADEGSRRDLAQARRLVREALGHSRTLAGDLRERTTLPPLAEALREFAAENAPAHTEVTVTSTGDEGLVSDASRRELFLALRECLANSLAHAGPGRIEVTTRVTRRWAHARVEDHGTGFDLTATDDRRGQGLRSMTERIEDIGGRLTLETAPGEGTRVNIHVPLAVRPQPHP